MGSPYRIDEIENWASDFSESPSFDALSPQDKEYAATVAVEFLKHACETEDVSAGSVGEPGARAALLDHLPKLNVPADVRTRIPEILAIFLRGLQDQGRLAGGASLGTFVLALGPAFRKRCAPDGGVLVPPVRNSAPALGRNDPCPCGSGKKFKKCCRK